MLSWFAHDVGGYGGFCRIGTVSVLLYAGEDDRFSLNALLKFRHLSLPPSGGIFLSVLVGLVKNLPDKKKSKVDTLLKDGLTPFWRLHAAIGTADAKTNVSCIRICV
ncbi:hypothetical protein C3Y05_006290 [Aeromonas allosaccharophila]|uniref:hypothetical protein n=1 Tax=Aeromonas allosaccharophila TaxID=656 RepID=UPI0013D037E6|nr:hypothetical protein [Aeromonas allosaccharophila]WDO03222.1 hypothetical protein C3Y05_006290 [Aeromonas allosaccharophila]